MFLTSILIYVIVGVTTVAANCNPITDNHDCDPFLGFTADYSVDFTKINNIPPEWILANYEHVGLGTSKGAEFALAKRGDAPAMWTEAYLFYGKVEVVLQAAPGVGVITAAVLMSDTADEIDWEFSGNDYGQQDPTLQTNYFGKGITTNWDRGTQPHVKPNLTLDYHTYTIDWTPDSLTWYFDGSVIRTLLAKDCKDNDHQYPQTPARFHLSLWDAGDPDTYWGTVVWAGGYTDLTKLPYTAYVKSVSIKPFKPCYQYKFTDKTGSKDSVQCIQEKAPASSSTSTVTSVKTSEAQSIIPPTVATGSSTLSPPSATGSASSLSTGSTASVDDRDVDVLTVVRTGTTTICPASELTKSKSTSSNIVSSSGSAPPPSIPSTGSSTSSTVSTPSSSISSSSTIISSSSTVSSRSSSSTASTLLPPVDRVVVSSTETLPPSHVTNIVSTGTTVTCSECSIKLSSSSSTTTIPSSSTGSPSPSPSSEVTTNTPVIRPPASEVQISVSSSTSSTLSSSSTPHKDPPPRSSSSVSTSPPKSSSLPLPSPSSSLQSSQSSSSSPSSLPSSPSPKSSPSSSTHATSTPLAIASTNILPTLGPSGPPDSLTCATSTSAGKIIVKNNSTTVTLKHNSTTSSIPTISFYPTPVPTTYAKAGAVGGVVPQLVNLLLLVMAAGLMAWGGFVV